MNCQTISSGPLKFSSRPLKMMVLAFLGFTLAAAALSMAGKMGYIESALLKRALGLIIGAMVIIIGNALPKARPLNAPGVNPPGPAAGAERFAGWILVVVGMAYIALFAFAPLDEARRISAVLGIGAMIYIAASWAWMARGLVWGGREESLADRERAAGKRKLILPLLLAFCYVLSTASMVVLVHNRHLVEEIGWWMFLGFLMLYAGLRVVLDRKRCVS
jgi:hypothetical protein